MTAKFPIGDTSNELAQSIATQLFNCSGFDGDTLSKDREQALNYYFQRARGDEVEGRAQVVSGDVSAMVEATVAQMMEAFSSSRIVDFDPLDADDEDQAQLESEAVQYYVMGRENGFLQLTAAIKEALLLRNGVIKIEAVDRTERRTRRLGNVEPEALAELISGDDVVAHDYDEDDGELSVTVKQTTREFVMSSESLENFLYHADWHQPTLTGIPLCALRHIDTRADLIALGFDHGKVYGLTAHQPDTKTESQARDPKNKNQTSADAIDKSQELVEWYEVYIRMQADDGADDQRRVCMSYTDAVVFENIAVSRVRMASGTCILNPHRFTGISLFDKLKQSQDVRTGLRRALLDNVTATNKSRLAGLDGVVNVDDVSDGRINNMVRVKNIVADIRAAVMPIVTQDTSANILANLESTARERSEMGGAALDMQSASLQIGGDRMGSQGLDRAYSVAEQLSAAMMKTIAATMIRDTFLLAHSTLREFFDDELPIKRNGKWQFVKPSQWPERRSVTVKPGMSAGERTRRANALGQVIDAQMMLADKGMDEVLVDLDGFNRAMLDWSRLMEVQNPEQYFVDPQSDQAQAALKKKDEARQAASMQSKALMQQAFGLEQLRVALGKYDGDADRVLEYFKAVLSSEVEEAKIVGSATTDLIKQQRTGNENANGAAVPGGSTTVKEQPPIDGDT
jgi:hypothetical protein